MAPKKRPAQASKTFGIPDAKGPMVIAPARRPKKNIKKSTKKTMKVKKAESSDEENAVEEVQSSDDDDQESEEEEVLPPKRRSKKTTTAPYPSEKKGSKKRAKNDQSSEDEDVVDEAPSDDDSQDSDEGAPPPKKKVKNSAGTNRKAPVIQLLSDTELPSDEPVQQGNQKQKQKPKPATKKLLPKDVPFDVTRENIVDAIINANIPGSIAQKDLFSKFQSQRRTKEDKASFAELLEDIAYPKGKPRRWHLKDGQKGELAGTSAEQAKKVPGAKQQKRGLEDVEVEAPVKERPAKKRGRPAKKPVLVQQATLEAEGDETVPQDDTAPRKEPVPQDELAADDQPLPEQDQMPDRDKHPEDDTRAEQRDFFDQTPGIVQFYLPGGVDELFRMAGLPPVSTQAPRTGAPRKFRSDTDAHAQQPDGPGQESAPAAQHNASPSQPTNNNRSQALEESRQHPSPAQTLPPRNHSNSIPNSKNPTQVIDNLQDTTDPAVKAALLHLIQPIPGVSPALASKQQQHPAPEQKTGDEVPVSASSPLSEASTIIYAGEGKRWEGEHESSHSAAG